MPGSNFASTTGPSYNGENDEREDFSDSGDEFDDNGIVGDATADLKAHIWT